MVCIKGRMRSLAGQPRRLVAFCSVCGSCLQVVEHPLEILEGPRYMKHCDSRAVLHSTP